ncbi:MAG: carboxypeptidase regulatory-like domain-containing protein [Candidatus Brocadiales bacterium]|nr:carboxypeptidase regulatory-like domain-containing protein [Candidatus Brocadiales bacterium]
MRTILFFLYRSKCNFVFCTAVLLSVVLTVTGALSASTTPQIASGGDHTIALKSDGTVWAWGYNEHGELGDGTTTTEFPYGKTTPIQVSGLRGVTAIAGREFHSIALKSDGTVWAWGSNSFGKLGDGTTTDRTTPVQVSGLSGITAIAVGRSHSIALKSDGTVWAWGGNYSGQLGDGTTTNRTFPVQISGLSGVTAIASGDDHTIALKSNGTVWTWGYNGYGALGDGTTTDRTTPVQVNGFSGVTAIAGGGYHTLAIKSDGMVWTWGYNGYGLLGDGTRTDRTTPVQVSDLSGVTAIAGGQRHSIALKSDGTVWAWGYNYFGQLGDGTTTDRTTPVQVSGLSGVSAITGGYYHTIALKSDGRVWTWGYNEYGQLGDGTTTDRTTPVQVNNLILKPAIPTVTTISAINVMFYSATLNGSVNANDASTTAWFEYGIISGVYSYSTATETVNGVSNTIISIQVNGLLSGTTYYYRIVAQNSEGISYGDEMSFTTLADTITPSCSISINNSAAYTNNSTVIISLFASDNSGVTGYYLSLDSTVPSTSANGWTDITSTTEYYADVSYTLSSEDGNKTVYVWFKDASENISDAANDSIILDSTAPTIYITSPTSEDTYTTASSVIAIGGSASDKTSGISSVTWSNDKGGSGMASGTTSWLTSSVSLLNGENIITVTATDEAGNTGTDQITVILGSSQKSSISGYVVDKRGNPVESAKIRLKRANSRVLKKTFSDEDGFFEFTDLDADTYIITALKSGYKMVKQTITLEEGEEKDIEIVIKRRSKGSPILKNKY